MPDRDLSQPGEGLPKELAPGRGPAGSKAIDPPTGSSPLPQASTQQPSTLSGFGEKGCSGCRHQRPQFGVRERPEEVASELMAGPGHEIDTRGPPGRCPRLGRGPPGPSAIS